MNLDIDPTNVLSAVRTLRRHKLLNKQDEYLFGRVMRLLTEPQTIITTDKKANKAIRDDLIDVWHLVEFAKTLEKETLDNR